MKEEPESGGKNHDEMAWTEQTFAEGLDPDPNDLEDTLELPARWFDARMKLWPDDCNPL